MSLPLSSESIYGFARPLLALLGVAALLAGVPARRPADVIDRALQPEGSAAIAELRAQGRTGLETLLAARAKDTRGLPSERWDATIDGVAGQRYASASHLYWYTDLEAAKAEASRTGRPILALRMLGDLTDVYSCANSRFFRTLLYPEPSVAAELADHWVLWWSSERPVPQVTVDFGGGRTFHTTITGNSVHYVLDAEGQPIDAIPGLYGPSAFLLRLQAARGLMHRILTTGPAQDAIVKAWHAESLAQTTTLVASRLARGRRSIDTERVAEAYRVPAGALVSVDARFAIPMAMTKAMPEMPVARAMLPGTPKRPFAAAKARLADEAEWAVLAASYMQSLAPESLEILRRERPDADLSTMAARLEESVAQDTAVNEHWLHGVIHTWFVENPSPDFATLNTRVYTELFATPSTDPWLGLRDEGVYDGIPGAPVQRN